MVPTVIRTSIIKMLFVLALLSLMGFWQIDFLMTGISANVFLNSCIFATFFFGIYTALNRVIGLKNDIFALRSLREDFDDAVNGDKQDSDDAMWRYYRCSEKAIVIHPPKILERPYTILSEEIAQTRDLKVTTGVMQNLLDSVDEQLDEGRSLISYVTGLLVFLGLIGTFIGLMVTLGSVGDIIGGLDLSGGAGADAIQKLMEDLMIPLQGMATGFSSSLFGLITSLALGLVALFGNQAANSFKSEFATWLSGVAKVRSDAVMRSPSDTTREVSGEGTAHDMSIMYRIAKLSLVSNARVSATVEALSEANTSLLQSQERSEKEFKQLVVSLTSISQTFNHTNQMLDEVINLLSNQPGIDDSLLSLQTSANQNNQILQKLGQSLTAVSDQSGRIESISEAMRDSLSKRDKIESLMEQSDQALANEFKRLNGAIVRLSDTVSLIDDKFDTIDSHLESTTEELKRVSQDLRFEIDWVIEQSKTATTSLRYNENTYSDEISPEQRKGFFGKIRKG